MTGPGLPPATHGPDGARFDDLVGSVSWAFDTPRRVLRAHGPGQVRDVLRAVDRATTAAGLWAYGYVGFDAAAAFDPGYVALPAVPGGPPAAWFALCDAPRVGAPVGYPAAAPPSGRWEPHWTGDDHAQRVRALLAAIGAGELYQANLTMPVRGQVGDPAALYRSLVHAQAGAYNAYLPVDDHVIVSASPELFFDWTGRELRSRPMKGTAPRSPDATADADARRALLASEKERAENVMIVDLVRNDLARVAQTGSVRVSSLWCAEPFETVWQLTSEVRARTRRGATLDDVFAALFPPGSVTGAPKAAALARIAALESGARGPYCGAIGMLAPPGGPFRARFGVAIRTAVVDRRDGRARYDVGGGITAGSDPAGEYAEALLKAAVLTVGNEPFSLIETMRHAPGEPIRNLDRHLARLAGSARHFGFPFDAAALRARLVALPEPAGPTRVRVLLDPMGEIHIERSPAPARPASPVRLALDGVGTTPDRWSRHKTTRRQRYIDAARRYPHADDVILVDGSGQVIETTIANLAACCDGQWCTPPLSSGCLPGVERTRLVEAGVLRERRLDVGDVRAADRLAVISSLRGWRDATLIRGCGDAGDVPSAP